MVLIAKLSSDVKGDKGRKYILCVVGFLSHGVHISGIFNYLFSSSFLHVRSRTGRSGGKRKGVCVKMLHIKMVKGEKRYLADDDEIVYRV